MNHCRVSTTDRARVKRRGAPPTLLTQGETERLLRAFLADKTQVREEDVFILARWAQRVRMEAVLLEMVLDGEVIPTVEDGEVSVAFRTPKAS